MTCAEVRAAIGADVLGALDPAEADALREHLSGCPDCRGARDELSDVPALLSLVTTEQLEHALGPPDEVGIKRLQARVRSRNRRDSRRRWRTVLVAAALLVVAAAGGGWAVGRWVTPHPAVVAAPIPHAIGRPVQWTGVNPTSKIDAAVTMNPVRWGTQVDIKLHGVKKGEWCSLVVYDRSGRRWNGGSWKVADSSGVVWSGGVWIRTDQVVRIEITAPDSRPLVELDG